MPHDRRSIFREKSLERLSSPERLDQLLRVVDRKSWIPLATLAVLVAIVITWSVIGRVPVNVHGRGILVHPRQIAEIHAPGAGYLEELKLEVGKTVTKEQLVGVIKRPDLETQKALQEEKAAELVAASRENLLRLRQRVDVDQAELDADELENEFALARALAGRLRDQEIEALELEQHRLQEHWEAVSELPEKLKKRREDQLRAFEQKLIAEEDLVRAETSYMDSLSDVESVRAQRNELRTRRLQVDDNYLGRLQGIADREQQLADVRREIARINAVIARETQIFAEHSGEVIEIGAVRGQYVNPGERLGAIAVAGAPEELRAAVYFRVKDGKRLRETESIQIAPDTVERQRWGSIEATIESVSRHPVSLEEVVSVVGNRGLAESLAADGYRMQVFARLHSDESCFVWTSGKCPDVAISAGTTTTSRAAVERRPPYTFVLPYFRSATGVD